MMMHLHQPTEHSRENMKGSGRGSKGKGVGSGKEGRIGWEGWKMSEGEVEGRAGRGRERREEERRR